mmetsp:Transcript_23960/g.49492  ORF Transcript_23960/g.49492 Transcript_23960/m.49492 type:complete len:113 (-) Transcript_23960:314-652(-)
MFLRSGAKYRLLGADPLPELMEDNPDFANPAYEIKRFVLDADENPLHSELYNTYDNGDYKAGVVLNQTQACYGEAKNALSIPSASSRLPPSSTTNKSSHPVFSRPPTTEVEA